MDTMLLTGLEGHFESRQVRRDVMSVLAGTTPTPLSLRPPSDSSAFVDMLLDCWRVLPSVPQTTFQDALTQVLQPEDFVRLHDAWQAVTAFGRAQCVGALALLEAFELAGLQYSLLKGAAAGYRLYEHPYMRASWDFDVAVRRVDLRAAERLAREVGFRPAQRTANGRGFEAADPKVRAAVEAKHYELGFLVRRLQVTNLPPATLAAIRAVYERPWTHQFWEDVNNPSPWCYSIVDIHHALSLDINVDDLLATARPLRADRPRVMVPSDCWLAAHLIFKIYWEGVHSYKKGLYQFADLVRLVPSLTADSFSELVEILERFGMMAAGHYVLRRVPEFGVQLPPAIASFVEDTLGPPPGAEPQPLNDLGDMWAKLWGHR